jgi:hypothetical protein
MQPDPDPGYTKFSVDYFYLYIYDIKIKSVIHIISTPYIYFYLPKKQIKEHVPTKICQLPCRLNPVLNANTDPDSQNL